MGTTPSAPKAALWPRLSAENNTALYASWMQGAGMQSRRSDLARTYTISFCTPFCLTPLQRSLLRLQSKTQTGKLCF